MTRLLIVARNDQFPALSDGALTSHGCLLPVGTRPALSPSKLPGGPYPFLPPRMRGNSASPSGEAPLFDATAEQWIVPPSGMTPDAGAAAELRHTQAAHTRSSAIPLKADERPLHPIVECLTVALGLTVFGLIAAALLVLA